jgi:hypothetical protein
MQDFKKGIDTANYLVMLSKNQVIQATKISVLMLIMLGV